jgi:SAM-dependent methyltransferase
MPFELLGLPIFYEAYCPDQASRFDKDLDEISKLTALEKQRLSGYCNLAGAETEFLLLSENFREDLLASVSNSVSRHRQVICALALTIFGSPHATLVDIAQYINERRLRVYLAEANSPLFSFLKAQLDPDLFICSEYLGPENKSGDIVNDIRHEDLQQTSFPDESFDIIITCDVFEHIPNAIVAEQEVLRILKPDGIYCFTVPYSPHNEHDIVLAEVAGDGEINYLAEPQYHGDPIRPEEGILVYRLFSFTDLAARFEALGANFTSYRFWSKALGIIDANGWVQVVTKKSEEPASRWPGLAGGRLLRESQQELRELQQQLSATQTEVAQSQSEIKGLTGSISELTIKLDQQEHTLKETVSQLSKQREVLTWIYSSRAWRSAGFLQKLALFANRLRASVATRQNKLGLGGATFYGAVDMPNIGEQLDVSGWVFSTAAPVVRVEAFFDQHYLGTLTYGYEREDLASMYPSENAKHSGYREKFLLPASLTENSRLTLRAFDAVGNVHVFSRPLRHALDNEAVK